MNDRYGQLKIVGTKMIAILGNKLIELGRRATGNLINSMESVVEVGNDYVQVSIIGENYWYWVNYGVEPQNVPYNPNVRTGAGTSKYIGGLIDWLKTKGIGSGVAEIRAIAFMIARKHSEVGIPVDKSKLGFVEKSMPLIMLEQTKLDDMFQKELDDVAEKALNKVIEF
tara:strand:+ start:1987 stop:2493 length:507 start_codon:yes stop_codon:yes gene_type:complete